MESDFKIVDYILSLSEQTSSCHAEIDSYDKTLQTVHSLDVFIMFFLNSIICLFFILLLFALLLCLWQFRQSCLMGEQVANV